MTTTKEPVSAEFHQMQACRAAMAREFMRMFHVTDEVIAARVAMDEAIQKYRQSIREAVNQQSGNL